MTLKDHYALFKNTCVFWSPTRKKNRLHCQRQRCRPMTLDSDNIRFMRIFAGVPWKRGVIQQWGNRKRVFSRFRMLRTRHLRKWGQHYYIVSFSPLSPFHWHQNPWLWMTLNGLKEPLTNYLLLIYGRLFITCATNAWPADKCGKQSIANSDPQSGRIFGIRRKSASLPSMLYHRNLNI